MPVFDREAVNAAHAASEDALREEAVGLLRELAFERMFYTYYAGKQFGRLHSRPENVKRIVTRLEEIQNELSD